MAKNFYITTTLPYVNAKPHIGFALELIQADVIARSKRQQGFEVFFNMGADEHGVKILRKAQEAGMESKAYCDIYAAKFNNLKETLNVTYDNFIRTTDETHVVAAQEFWKLCEKNGDIYKKNYKVKYCVGCELEKTDSELQNGKCPIHPNLEVEIIDEENYFFKYSKYQQMLLDFYEKNSEFVVPGGKFNEIKEFTKKGLEDFSISRLKEKMPWGVDVPGDEKHIMYVWFDALVSYISTLGWPEDAKKFKQFWPGMQMAGKDNLRQQSSMWQAMLMSAGLLNSKQIFIHGFILANGQKMSKSLGNVVDPFELVKKYGVDAVRYYLLREITPTEDGDFTIEKFEQRYNADLAGGIGNLVARTLAMAAKLNSKLQITNHKQIQNSKLQEEIKRVEKECKNYLEEFKFNDALKSIWELISFCDKYINTEKPWAALPKAGDPRPAGREGKENALRVIADILFALDAISGLLDPFLPGTAKKIKETVASKKSVILFPRLDAKK